MGTHGKKNSYSVIEGGKRNMRALTKAAEKETREYFKHTLYEALKRSGIVSDVITDIPSELDLKGIDVKFIGPDGKEINVDEKGQFMYLNDPTGTWSFEISYNDRKGDLVDGWWLQCEPGHPDQHLTDYFCLTYIDNVSTDELENYSADKIKQVTTLFVKTSDLIDYMKSKGKTFDDLWNDAEDARYEYSDRRSALMSEGRYKELDKSETRRVRDPAFRGSNGRDEAYYYVSDGKKDVNSSPVNLVINKKILESFPNSREFIVFPDVVVEQHLPIPPVNVKNIRDNNMPSQTTIFRRDAAKRGGRENRGEKEAI